MLGGQSFILTHHHSWVAERILTSFGVLCNWCPSTWIDVFRCFHEVSIIPSCLGIYKSLYVTDTQASSASITV